MGYGLQLKTTLFVVENEKNILNCIDVSNLIMSSKLVQPDDWGVCHPNHVYDLLN